MAPDSALARVPATSAFSASDTTSSRRSGISALMPRDQDADTGEIGEAAHGIDHDLGAARIQRPGRQGGHAQIGDQLIEDQLDAHQAAGRPGLAPGHAQQPDQRREQPAQHPLQGQRRARTLRQHGPG